MSFIYDTLALTLIWYHEIKSAPIKPIPMKLTI